MPEWTPAGVCIFGWSRSRSQFFRLEPEQKPESTLRSVQEPIKIFKGPIKNFVMMLSNEMDLIETCSLTSVGIYHKSETLGGSNDHFTTNIMV